MIHLSVNGQIFRLITYLRYCTNCAMNSGMHMFFWMNVFVCFVGRYPEVEFVSHMIVQCLVYWNISMLFPRNVEPGHIPTNSGWVILFHHTCQYRLLPVLLIYTIITCVRWYLIVILIWIFLNIQRQILYFYGQQIFDTGAKNIKWSKYSLFNNWCWENCITMCKMLKLYPYLIPNTKFNSND